MKKYFWLTMIAAALLLAACAPAAQPTPTETAPPPTATTAPPTEAPAATATTEAAAEPTAAEADAGAPAGLTTYTIVPGESQVSYTVDETFLNQNNRFATAIGVTTQITGEVYGDPSDPQSSRIGVIQVDVSQFASDSSRRDQAIRGSWLESGKFPLATFTPTAIEALPASYAEGSEQSFKVTGDLTVREVTLPVTFDVTAKLEGNTLSGVASTTVLMSEFGVGPVSIAGILNTEDEVLITFNFVARSS